MNKTRITKYWPFKAGERVKLIRISRPYQKDDHCWYIDGLFYSDQECKTHKIYFKHADLLMLHLDGFYIDAKFESYGSVIVEMNISIPEKKLKNNLIKPYLITSKIDHFNYYTFGFSYNGSFVIIPLIEIVRAVLATDSFWMNKLTQLDTLYTAFISICENDILDIQFNTTVSTSYIQRNEKINHMAWLLTNSNILEMLNSLYYNIWDGKGFLFDFQFSSLDMNVLAEKRDNKIFVKEILHFRNKQINAKEISVCHPRLYSNTSNGETKDQELKTIILNKHEDELCLDADKTADFGEPDFGNEPVSSSHYANKVKINRKREKREQPQSVETDKTRKRYIEDDGARTTTESGGMERIHQIEFDNPYIYSDTFKEIDEIIELLQGQNGVSKTQKCIGLLQKHVNASKFATLKDGYNPRRYFIGLITLQNAKEAMLIEIEREEHALSTLMLVSDGSINQHEICDKILKNIAGSWPTDILNEVTASSKLAEYRYSHATNNIKTKAEKIFKDIINA